MNNFSVQISDRQRLRHVSAENPRWAVEALIGKRLIHARMDNWSQDGRQWVFDVAVRTGPTVGNSTPFKNIRAYVNLE